MRPNNFDGGRPRFGLWAGGLAVAVLLGYALFAALPYLLGPSLTLESDAAENGMATIHGTTKRVSYLSINGLAVPLEESGNFSVTRAYPFGYTVIQASARDRFGRTITKTISFTTLPTTTYGKKESGESTTTGAVIR